jgi:hypothetical protein
MQKKTRIGGYMNAITGTSVREFKVWMTVTLGLLKDGRMGVSRARAERIRTAMANARKGN